MLPPTITHSARIVCNFSCGAASAVMTKLVIAQYGETNDVQIINAEIKEEHPDNRRFLDECEQWFGRPITRVCNTKYNGSAIAVFRGVRFMKGRKGAPCTRILKRELLDSYALPGDVLALGFTAEEGDRMYDFRQHNPDRPMIAPLVSKGLGKEDCKAMVLRAGIELPIMYRLGYENANCIGCVKGGMGYFRAIREDFPDQFEELAKIQDELGQGSWLWLKKKGSKERISLRNLPEGPASRNEALPACSFFCEMSEEEYQ